MQALQQRLLTASVLRWARAVYDYHQLRHTPQPAEVVVAFGTNDIRVAHHAADLYHQGFGKLIVCTGGVAHLGDLLATGWDEPESLVFARAAMECGVPAGCILQEPRATNTAENIRFTRELLREYGIVPQNLLLAMKPFMQRRVWATMAVEWPEMPATVSSPQLTFEEFCSDGRDMATTIDIMLGDLQRLRVYGERGWSAPQRWTEEVTEAYESLKAAGFTRHLLPGP